MEAGAEVASHVAFEIDRAWCDDAQGALDAFAVGEETKLAVVLGRWWRAREARVDAATVALDAEARGAIVKALEDGGDGLAAELAATAPAVVRRDALLQLQRVAPRLARLIAVSAPEIILDRQRVVCAQHLAELDPATRREQVPVPEIGTTLDAGGVEVVHLRLWMDRMLAAAHADGPDVGSGELDDAQRESAAFVLPRRFEVPGTPPRVMVAESSGPITWATAGDVPGEAVAPALAARVRGLGRDRALVSFVWMANDSAGPWRPIG